ncbi:CLUMA_CG003968, isoform A [Clunio marinus]|uniref:CLUMA_CG003968, isoform A n=1 Tax=Clunio marinus TaxID=568069 RepID=A0A1J1HVT0_9DIPT|nr:CLUMA_CG003968, isoform A [Clunio marinus]
MLFTFPEFCLVLVNERTIVFKSIIVIEIWSLLCCTCSHSKIPTLNLFHATFSNLWDIDLVLILIKWLLNVTIDNKLTETVSKSESERILMQCHSGQFDRNLAKYLKYQKPSSAVVNLMTAA